MRSSVVKGVFIFAAGAATAVLAGSWYPPPPITVGEFQERATSLIAQVEALSVYVDVVEEGRVAIFTDPYACAPPTPPRPTLPKGAVDAYSLQKATFTLISINERYLKGDYEAVHATDKCKPYAK